jgi:hypothetical protein
MFYKCKVKKALGKMALWLLPKRGLLRVGAKANVPLCGGKKMNKKCAVGKKKKYRRVSKECRLTRCPVSIWSVFVCLSVKMVYFSCPSVRYCQVARSSVTLAANYLILKSHTFLFLQLMLSKKIHQLNYYNLH